MSDNLYAPIKIANPVEVRQDWAIVMQSLSELAHWISRTFAIDVTNLVNVSTEIYVGSSKPTGEDKGKIWIKNTSPPAIGIPFSDDYIEIYPYPPLCPVLWTGGAGSHPSYMRKLSETELEQFALTNPESDNYYYIILEP